MENEVLDNDWIEKKPIIKPKLATFGTRLLASLIDSLVFLPLGVLMYYNLTTWKGYMIVLLATIAQIIYKPYMEWKYQATLGKIAMKIKVVDYNFEAITFEQSLKRFTFYFISYFAGLISTIALMRTPGFEEVSNFTNLGVFQENNENHIDTFTSILLLASVIPVAFNPKRQGWHDQLAKTYCIHKEGEPNAVNNEKRMEF